MSVFFFQAEDGIRDVAVTGVQTCALPISRVTAQISLAGRFLVYMPFASKVGVSRKIENREQRAKLREMVSKLVPKDPGAGGWIIRTVAEDLTEQSCKRGIEHLYRFWAKNKRQSGSGRAPAPPHTETVAPR